MKNLHLPLALLLLPVAAQATVTVDEFATGRIYSSVTSDGVAFFTDIEPDDLGPVRHGGSASTARMILPQGKVVNVDVTAVRHSGAPGFAVETPLAATPDQPLEELPPRED